jgi:DNA polymerase-3 subunit delta
VDALNKLAEFVGNDLWQMENEIKKLISFKGGKIIKKEDVEILVKSRIETDIFETIDSLALKNKRKALELIHKHLEKGDSPLYLLSMINFQFRNLLIIKDLIEKGRPYYTFQKITQLHPFVIKKSYSQSQRFSLQELKKIYQKIFQVDLNIKTGKLDPQTALDLFIAEI